MVEVVAGTLPYAVRLATTRSPDAEDEALLEPGEAVELRTGDVAPGETIDARLEYAAQDGSGTAYVDELDDWTLTRPTTEECDPATAPPPSPPPAEPLTPEPTPTPEPSTPRRRRTGPRPPSPLPRRPRPRLRPAVRAVHPAGPGPRRPGSPAAAAVADPAALLQAPPSTARPERRRHRRPGRAGAATPVAAGGTVRIRVEGYEPGEQVTIAPGRER